MQTLKITSTRGEIVLSDHNSSSIDGVWAPLKIYSLDPNSNALNVDAVSCVDMHGQHVIGSVLAPKTVTLDISFNGEYLLGGKRMGGGAAKTFDYRRKLLTHMPLNEKLQLEYTNDNGTFLLTARLSAAPLFEIRSSICAATLYFTADYPFWHQDRIGGTYVAVPGNPASVVVYSEGDIASPMIGKITCTSAVTASVNEVYFRIKQYEGGDAQMDFVRPLEAGDVLEFNSGLNNEVYVRLMRTGEIILANNYVKYAGSSLLVNNPGETKWRLSILGGSGALNIQMRYQNLFLGV